MPKETGFMILRESYKNSIDSQLNMGTYWVNF